MLRRALAILAAIPLTLILLAGVGRAADKGKPKEAGQYVDLLCPWRCRSWS